MSAEIHLGQDKAATELSDQMVKNGGHQNDGVNHDAVDPTFPVHLVNKPSNLLVLRKGSVCRSTPLNLWVGDPVQVEGPDSALALSRNFGLDWISHPKIRRFAPAGIYLAQDKEYTELIDQ